MTKQASEQASPPKAESRSKRTFTIKAPGALSVLLVGDFTQWQQSPIRLQEEADGCWQVEVDLAPGPHYHRFLVDGEWRDDPECTLYVPNPYGSQNAVRQVS